MASLLFPATSSVTINPQQVQTHSSIQSLNSISLHLSSNSNSIKFRSSLKGLRSHRSNLTLVRAQLNEVSIWHRFSFKDLVSVFSSFQNLFLGSSLDFKVTGDGSPNVVANGSSKLGGIGLEMEDLKQDDKPLVAALASDESVGEFLAQVSALVKLVDSRDVMELQLKQSGCELVIRKKEALPQPPLPDNGIMMYSPPPAAVAPPAPVAPMPVSSSAKVPAPSPPAGKPKSSHPPLKCPMAGTFYRCPAPGEPPFMKVGDKVQKGQIICIIEAMKLMNEIEADRTGTVVEILVEDGKPVSVDTPLFAIEP